MSAEGPVRDGTGSDLGQAGLDRPGFDLPDFQLLETMRWQPDGGFMRLERHLARLYASATDLGFSYDAQRVGETLINAVTNPQAVLRARLVLSRNGDVTASTQTYEPLPEGKVWKLKLARTHLDSSDPLLRHKTTRRQTYVHARSEYLVQQADEVLLSNERGELCEGTITNIFADFGDGIVATPRLDSGLLPGVLRAELLEQGHAIEAVMTFDNLHDARQLYVGNSLRGLIPAVLA